MHTLHASGEEDELYRHKPTGNVYVVLGEALCTTNGPNDGQLLVIYAKHPARYDEHTFAREKTEFLERFEKVK